MKNEFVNSTGPKNFPYKQLVKATDNFAKENKLGEGGFGGVYKGFVEELNSFVAIKKISQGCKQGVKEYASEVKIISQLRHKNLVRLIGWCHEHNEPHCLPKAHMKIPLPLFYQQPTFIKYLNHSPYA